jgi:iron complex transport system ATP-binding protein
MFEAQNIRVTLGGKSILHGVDFQARPGEITAIVGPNGSGKSTFIKAICQDHAYDGSVTLNGRDLSGYEPYALAALRGVLPQEGRLAFPFTVAEVLRIGLSAGIHGDDPGLLDRALGLAGLQGYAHRTFHDLSGGEQQRAHLARVLCQVWQPVVDGVPRWLLLDEPVASLDIGHQLIVMRCLQDYAARGGGVIAVMHDLNLTAMIADQITMMMDGRVLASGAPDAVLTDQVLSQAYGCTIRTNHVPTGCASYLLPQAALQTASLS